MGASSSKLEGDRALLLCRERKHFVRQALEGRCTLAAAHVSYIESLKNTGTALRKFVEPEATTESSLYTSTSATPEPLALTEKSLSQISYSSPRLSHHVDPIENFSPTPSPPYSRRFHVSYMKARGISSTVVEERPPVPVSATLRSSSGAPKTPISRGPSEAQSFEPPSPPGTSAWDYFSPFHPIDHQFSFQDGRGLHRDLDNADDIKRFREAEKIPDLEDDEETSSFTPKEEGSSGSEDNFDEPSSVPLVQSYERRADTMDSYSPSASPTTPPLRNTRRRKQLNGDKNMLRDEMDKADESGTPNMTQSKSTPRLRPLPAEEKAGLAEEPTSEKLAPKDFLSSIKEIEFLFLKASEEGKEVPRMLEAKKLAFRPMFPEANVRRSRVSTLFSACLACMEEPEQVSQDTEPPVNGIKYLTWHRSTSSLSSSSRNLIGSTSKEETMESNDNLFNSSCMNSGSHALTLDRLYAWERKLYDEIKASGIIRREYEMKCRLLRHQDSKGESPIKIDKTRAAVKDLHSRIRVSIHRIDSISKRIEELRDKELQPQLEELIEGLSRMWEMMVECHKLQFNIISVAYNNGHSKVSLQSESHRQATLLLEYELNSLCSSFTKWVGVQKFYLQAINGWLLKCVFPLRQKSVSRRNNVEFCPLKALAPPIFVTCRDWLNKLEELRLPTKGVVDGIKGLLKVTTCYLPRQEKAPKKDLTSSFSWKTEGVGDTASDMMRNEGPADWNSGFESLQSSLVVFFEQLYNFSDTSAKKYRELEDAIKEAKRLYEHGGLRTQM